jgi:hypothetical protein
MSQTVHVSGLPLVPLTAEETAIVVRNEMRRRAWDGFCADYMVEHPGETTWFINDDACATLKTWEHD